MSMIEASGVHVRFGDRVVLESVDLAVGEGEFHGVMGPNGAGKTTFFNVLTGRVKPSRGSIGSAAKTSQGSAHIASPRKALPALSRS
jgi:ABC-type multidrug transport system ATPase subunit